MTRPILAEELHLTDVDAMVRKHLPKVVVGGQRNMFQTLGYTLKLTRWNITVSCIRLLA